MPERVWRFTRAEREWVRLQASTIGAKVDWSAGWFRAHLFLGGDSSVDARLAVSVEILGLDGEQLPHYKVAWTSYPPDGWEPGDACSSLREAVRRAMVMLSEAERLSQGIKDDEEEDNA